ncbi:hypothetical protein T11_12927 [Trichinella zimbabwensis]|uniref:Uncharacterized protein n=1 Tax=Trichinella zimbabwensis TaxID=268475 RepID=A0A0V1I3F2_9BILA|nr:hypothetical protein T11_12927 [Trichinella zimbabwensis]
MENVAVRNKCASEANCIKASRYKCRIRSIFQFTLAYGIEFHCEQNKSNITKRLIVRGIRHAEACFD